MPREVDCLDYQAAQVENLAVLHRLKGREAQAELIQRILQLRIVDGFLGQRQVGRVHIGLVKAPVAAHVVAVAVGIDTDDGKACDLRCLRADRRHADGSVDDHCFFFSGDDKPGSFLVVIHQPDVVVHLCNSRTSEKRGIHKAIFSFHHRQAVRERPFPPKGRPGAGKTPASGLLPNG